MRQACSLLALVLTLSSNSPARSSSASSDIVVPRGVYSGTQEALVMNGGMHMTNYVMVSLRRDGLLNFRWYFLTVTTSIFEGEPARFETMFDCREVHYNMEGSTVSIPQVPGCVMGVTEYFTNNFGYTHRGPINMVYNSESGSLTVTLGSTLFRVHVETVIAPIPYFKYIGHQEAIVADGAFSLTNDVELTLKTADRLYFKWDFAAAAIQEPGNVAVGHWGGDDVPYTIENDAVVIPQEIEGTPVASVAEIVQFFVTNFGYSHRGPIILPFERETMSLRLQIGTRAFGINVPLNVINLQYISRSPPQEAVPVPLPEPETPTPGTEFLHPKPLGKYYGIQISTNLQWTNNEMLYEFKDDDTVDMKWYFGMNVARYGVNVPKQTFVCDNVPFRYDDGSSNPRRYGVYFDVSNVECLAAINQQFPGIMRMPDVLQLPINPESGDITFPLGGGAITISMYRIDDASVIAIPSGVEGRAPTVTPPRLIPVTEPEASQPAADPEERLQASKPEEPAAVCAKVNGKASDKLLNSVIMSVFACMLFAL